VMAGRDGSRCTPCSFSLREEALMGQSRLTPEKCMRSSMTIMRLSIENTYLMINQ
jgi:hypothetical protein